MYKAVIFDLDGTLADSLKSLANSANKAIGKFGFKPCPEENFKKFAGDGADELIKRVLRFSGDTELEYFERARAEYRAVFERECMYEVKPYKNIPELIDGLRKRGIKTAVLSNKPHERTVDVIKTLFPCGFDIVIGQSDERKRKPSPEGALYIAERLSVKPKECIYVGDTNTDMQTGKSADMFTVGVLWGFREKFELIESGADMIIENPLELIDISEKR